jgi:glycine/D-amino acid oxidase-like deaminating enzyme
MVRGDYGDDLLYAQLSAEALAGWRAWNTAFGEKLYRETGVVFLCESDPFDSKQDTFESQSVQVQQELYGSGKLHRIVDTPLGKHPFWDQQVLPSGYINDSAGWVDSKRTLQLLHQCAMQHGVTIKEECGVAELIEQNSSVVGIEDVNGQTHMADLVVLATGAWTTGSLLPELKSVLKPSAQPVAYLDASSVAAVAHAIPFGADITNSGLYGFKTDGNVIKVGIHQLGIESRSDPKYVNFIVCCVLCVVYCAYMMFCSPLVLPPCFSLVKVDLVTFLMIG